MFGRLLKAGRLLNFLHFQPRIFSEFIFYQQNKEHCCHFVLIFTSFFFLGGGGGGGDGGTYSRLGSHFKTFFAIRIGDYSRLGTYSSK